MRKTAARTLQTGVEAPCTQAYSGAPEILTFWVLDKSRIGQGQAVTLAKLASQYGVQSGQGACQDRQTSLIG